MLLLWGFLPESLLVEFSGFDFKWITFLALLGFFVVVVVGFSARDITVECCQRGHCMHDKQCV